MRGKVIRTGILLEIMALVFIPLYKVTFLFAVISVVLICCGLAMFFPYLYDILMKCGKKESFQGEIISCKVNRSVSFEGENFRSGLRIYQISGNHLCSVLCKCGNEIFQSQYTWADESLIERGDSISMLTNGGKRNCHVDIVSYIEGKYKEAEGRRLEK